MFGVTTNNLLKNIDWAKKGILSFSNTPLNMMSFAGMVLLGLCAVAGIAADRLRLLFPELVPPGHHDHPLSSCSSARSTSSASASSASISPRSSRRSSGAPISSGGARSATARSERRWMIGSGREARTVAELLERTNQVGAPIRILAAARLQAGHHPDGTARGGRAAIPGPPGRIDLERPRGIAAAESRRGPRRRLRCPTLPASALRRATYKAIDHAGAERNFGYSMPDTTYYEGDAGRSPMVPSTSSSAPKRWSTYPSRPGSWPRPRVA